MEEQLKKIAAECACFHFRRSARSVTRLFDEHLSEVGLRSTQFVAMLGVRLFGPVSVGELAKNLSQDQTGLSRNISLLVDKNWVAASADSKDRRRHLLTLTDSGVQKLQSAIPCWERAQSAVQDQYRDSSWQNVLNVLDRSASL